MTRLLLVLSLLLVAVPVEAQQTPEARLRARRHELDRIRREREQLEQRMKQLQSSVHDLSEEVAIIERQAEATARVVRSLDNQLTAINAEVGDATGNLVRAEDELVMKRAILSRRLADIYKRGPLYAVEVILSAESFGELVARYKYLHLLAQRDRALVSRVEQLRDQIQRQRSLLVRLRNDVLINRVEKSAEEQRLRELERQRETNLATLRRSARQTQARLERIERDEARLTDVIATLEAERRRAESRGNARREASTFSTRDLGRLDWPVEGDIIYRFGRVVNPNNTTTRWNGIGIAAETGTAVRSIAAGQVKVAKPFGTYGLTVIVQHSGGDYSIYGSLSRIDVQEGAIVSKGYTLGAVGSADPELPPHLHFEIRPGGRAVDPLDWLQKNRQ